MSGHDQGQPLLQAEGLKLRFGGIIAADGINLSLFPGEHLAIIGPNGVYASRRNPDGTVSTAIAGPPPPDDDDDDE